MKPLKINPSTRDAEFLRIRVDTLVGMAVSNVIGIAIIRPPVMALMMLLVRRKKVMSELQVEGWRYWLGWLATLVMALSVVGMAFSLASSQGGVI